MFHTPVARLYRLIGKENAVRTPQGVGTLLNALSSPKGCPVQLRNEKELVKNAPKKQPRTIMRYFDHEEVEEV